MKIIAVTVTPIAVQDPPLLNSLGVHEPYAIRTIIEIETDEGITGIGETYGDRALVDDLRAAEAVLVGCDPFDLHRIEGSLRGRGTPNKKGARMSPGSVSHRADSRLFAAIEVPCLDIQGKALNRPLCDLLGGAVRDEVEFSSYLFYKFAEHRDFDGYTPDPFGEALTPQAIVEQAQHFHREYGYGSLKLKGGVLEPRVEVETMLALRDAFPEQPMRIDPNAAWSIPTAMDVMRDLEGLLEYLEDPSGGLWGMAEVARHTATPLATNMAVIGFEEIPEAVRLGSCGIVLADHHYWGGLRRSMELWRVCHTFGIELSMHSNSHLSVSLAAMVHLGLAVPQMPYAFDTHQPWQYADDVIVGGKLPIRNGVARKPEGPGLGVELDHDQVARLHEQYLRCGIEERDDTGYMHRVYDPQWSAQIPRF